MERGNTSPLFAEPSLMRLETFAGLGPLFNRRVCPGELCLIICYPDSSCRRPRQRQHDRGRGKSSDVTSNITNDLHRVCAVHVGCTYHNPDRQLLQSPSSSLAMEIVVEPARLMTRQFSPLIGRQEGYGVLLYGTGRDEHENGCVSHIGAANHCQARIGKITHHSPLLSPFRLPHALQPRRHRQCLEKTA
jgi:hypothetical protein